MSLCLLKATAHACDVMLDKNDDDLENTMTLYYSFSRLAIRYGNSSLIPKPVSHNMLEIFILIRK